MRRRHRAAILGIILAVVLLVPTASIPQISISGGTPPLACDNSVAISTGASGSTELVALTSGQTIYVCSWVVVAGGTVSVKFVYGTGTNCATGATDRTGAMDFVANGGAANGSGTGRLFATAISNALCINLSGAVNVRGVVTYAKF